MTHAIAAILTGVLLAVIVVSAWLSTVSLDIPIL